VLRQMLEDGLDPGEADPQLAEEQSPKHQSAPGDADRVSRALGCHVPEPASDAGRAVDVGTLGTRRDGQLVSGMRTMQETEVRRGLTPPALTTA
jgi:hypothetical protein